MKIHHILGAVAGVLVSTSIAQAAVEPGDTAPAFTLKSAGGEEVSLSDFEGKTVVLEWVNYDCPFVKKHYGSGNMPMLQKKYVDKGVVWLSVNSSGEGKQGHYEASEMAARSKKEGNKATAVLLDPSGEVGKSYGAKTTPHMFVISSDGKIAYAGGIDDKPSTNVSDVEGATNYVAAALDALLKGEKVAVTKAKPYGCGVKY